ncbi:MAG TPA: ATP-binding protein [Bacteroidales bacterium]|nr:ATP-binding protein [Bacteroidales bacterium]
MKAKSDGRRTKKNFIRIVEAIANEAVNSDLSDQFIRSVKGSADEISAFLGCNRTQSILFSVICNLNFSNKTVSLEQIATWVGCNPITVAGYLNEIDDLRSKKIIRKETEEKKNNAKSISTLSWSVNPDIFNALTKGEAISRPRRRISDSYELIKAVSCLIDQCASDEITFHEMWREISNIEKKNSTIEFLKEVKRMIPDRFERILFIHLCNEYYTGNINLELIPKIRLITPDERHQLELRLTISNGNSHLVEQGLLEIRETFFRSEIEVRLSPKAVELLFKDNKKLIAGLRKEKSTDLISSKEIKHKKLFYNRDEKEKLNFVEQLLRPGNYSSLIKRLERSGNNTGIAMLFSGLPGTGKTESVYQIARNTGRDICQVNISDTKSKWFGESERLIKEVFDRYLNLCKDVETKPILLFNEADGIFSTRKKIGDSNVDQTENAIQNIILQEMEDLKGILIATTNMTQNLDKAFDRRFLYKIQFEKPSVEARFHIWKDKIPSLRELTALRLAETHDLSGGQIDNVARKYLMYRILQGKIPTHQQIESWCQEENTRQETKKIGYKF